MSNTEQWNQSDASLTIPCGRCEAKIDEACTTITGHRAARPHRARVWPLTDAFGAGYQEGFDDGTAHGKRVSAPVYTKARS